MHTTKELAIETLKRENPNSKIIEVEESDLLYTLSLDKEVCRYRVVGEYLAKDICFNLKRSH